MGSSVILRTLSGGPQIRYSYRGGAVVGQKKSVVGHVNAQEVTGFEAVKLRVCVSSIHCPKAKSLSWHVCIDLDTGKL